MNKSIDEQIKELREALAGTMMKATGLKLIHTGIKAGDMELVKTGWEMQEGLYDDLSKAIGVLNGE
jgi:hypothetical protein|tara:strand:+ start:202 stop:399 length:198 start_codon:yes stop_codon:yes gene_type:complete